MLGLEQEKKVFVAHFDIPGMSAVLRRSNSEAWVLLCDFAEASDTHELPITDPSRQTLFERFFSDTIIIRTSDDTTGALHTIIARSLELFRCAFRRSIPLRAGIAHDSWIESLTEMRELFTGDALLQAYSIGEEQQLLGISVCDVIRDKFLSNPFSLSNGSPVVIDYHIPKKTGGCKQGAVLNWPALCKNELNQITPLTDKALLHYFNTTANCEFLDDSVMAKYSNTINFINGCS